MQNIPVEIERLLGRTWSSFEELYGAVRAVIGSDCSFDCFEEWMPGVVSIRRKPIGCDEVGFDFRVELQKSATAIAA